MAGGRPHRGALTTNGIHARQATWQLAQSRRAGDTEKLRWQKMT